MKKYLLFVLLLLISISSYAGGDKYVAAMKGVLASMDDANGMEDLQNCANRFERIGNAEKKEWLPFYYAGLCHVIMSYMEPDMGKKDAHLDKAEAFQEMTKDMKVSDKEKAELMVLKGMVYSSRIQVDPQGRGMKYGPLSGQMYGRASALDPDNPRALLQQGQALLYTPEMWGGGKAKAIPVLEEAVAKYKAWEMPSEISPKWGQEDAEKALAYAKSDAKAPWEEEGEQVGDPEESPEEAPAPEGEEGEDDEE